MATMNKEMQEFIDKEFPRIRKIVSKEFAKHLPNVKASFVRISGRERLPELMHYLDQFLKDQNEEKEGGSRKAEVERASMDREKDGWPAGNKGEISAEQIANEIPRTGRKSSNLAPKILVFCNTVASCRAIHHHIVERGHIDAACFHGDLPNEKRDDYFEAFESGKSKIMVCTDIASRGLDMKNVSHVINFDFPLNITDYQHRIGRTGRMGKPGSAVSFITKRDQVLAEEIEAAIHGKSSMELISSDKMANLRRRRREAENRIDEKKRMPDGRQSSGGNFGKRIVGKRIDNNKQKERAVPK